MNPVQAFSFSAKIKIVSPSAAMRQRWRRYKVVTGYRRPIESSFYGFESAPERTENRFARAERDFDSCKPRCAAATGRRQQVVQGCGGRAGPTRTWRLLGVVENCFGSFRLGGRNSFTDEVAADADRRLRSIQDRNRAKNPGAAGSLSRSQSKKPRRRENRYSFARTSDTTECSSREVNSRDGIEF